MNDKQLDVWSRKHTREMFVYAILSSGSDSTEYAAKRAAVIAEAAMRECDAAEERDRAFNAAVEKASRDAQAAPETSTAPEPRESLADVPPVEVRQ